MIRVIVNGALGHMGAILVNLIEGAEDASLVAATDAASDFDAVLKSVREFKGEADVLIDFSHHTAAPEVMAWAAETKTPVVMATTGHDEGEKATIEKAAEEIPVFWAANLSMGVALLAQLAKKTAEVFPDADIEIVETHHNRKVDAPSGTAFMLAEAIKEVRPEAKLVLGRSGMGKREPGDIGISAVRRGNIPGIHEIIVTTETQSITLSHEVYDRALLAEGALAAARFLKGKPAGMYGMKDIIKG